MYISRLYLFLLCTLFFSCKNSEVETLKSQVTTLEEQLDHLQSSNSSLLDRMADMSIINRTGAESIKESIKNIGQQYEFIEDLTKKMQSKDSMNLALVMNLKRSLEDLDDDDIDVEVRGGLVHVSISDNLLFKSGSDRINPEGNQVVEKIATVLNDHDEMMVMVEGHTDDVPISNNRFSDNWALSVMRATSVVRMLQDEYGVLPERLTAAGKSEFYPREENDSDWGRSKNRRTEIVIQPRLDQFFSLLETPALDG